MPGLPFLEAAPQQLYPEAVLERRLFLHAAATGFAERPEVAEAVDRQLQAAARAALFATRMEEAIRREIDHDPEALETFYDNNRFLYQSPLRVKLQTLSVPVVRDTERQMAAVEEVHREVVAGTTDLAAAAARLGGTVTDLGWLDAEALVRIEPKVKVYVLDLRSTGYTVPFQLNRRLNIIRVEEREEPRVLPFEEIADRVRDDYFARHQQQLFARVVERILTAADFVFFEDSVRAALTLPGAEDPETPG